MRLSISTLALMAVAMMAVGSANAKPTEMAGNMPPEMYEELALQICSTKTIPDCQHRTKECFSLMNSTSDTPTCPGLSTTDCLQKLVECSALVITEGGGPQNPGSHGEGPPGHASPGSGPPHHGSNSGPHMEGVPMVGGMAGTMKQQAELMCSLSEDLTCIQEVMDCLMLEEQLMAGSTENTTKAHHVMCEVVDIADCKTKLMTCDEKMQALANMMSSSASKENATQGEMSMHEGHDMPPQQTAMIMCTVSEDPDCMEKVASCLVMTKTMAEESQMSEHADPNVCGGTTMAECMTKMRICDELMKGLSTKMDAMPSADMMSDMLKRTDKIKQRKNGSKQGRPKSSMDDGQDDQDESQESSASYEDDSETGTGGRRRKRDTGETDEGSYEQEEDSEEDQMMKEVEVMLTHFSAIMGIIDTVMDGKTMVLGTRPGVLPIREKAMYLSKYMCNHENLTDCALMTEVCATWLAPSPNLPVMQGMESNCSHIVPPPSSVADTCMDFNTDECKKEAVSCMNLLIATGGTSGYAGPLTPHSHQCEEMMMRMISSQSCSGKENTTDCEMAISVCMDTIRVKTDELHDHHFPEKLICEPVMRPAIALYMCSYRDEPDCFSRMHKCLVNMAPEAKDMKGTDTKEMVGCLKLTRPPVGVICDPEKGQGCKEKYDNCSNLVQPNTEFLKAAQGCMGLADEMEAKTCLLPALNEMTKSIDNAPVQGGIKDLYNNFWTPSMGIVGFHSCMVMVCTMEIKP